MAIKAIKKFKGFFAVSLIGCCGYQSKCAVCKNIGLIEDHSKNISEKKNSVKNLEWLRNGSHFFNYKLPYKQCPLKNNKPKH